MLPEGAHLQKKVKQGQTNGTHTLCNNYSRLGKCQKICHSIHVCRVTLYPNSLNRQQPFIQNSLKAGSTEEYLLSFYNFTLVNNEDLEQYTDWAVS